MKRIISVFVALIISTSLYAATYKQTGYIKEKGSDTHKGKKLSGVKIKVKDRNATYFSSDDGSFTLDGLDKIFTFEEIAYKDYMLVDDEELIWKREITSEPIKILMVSPKAFFEEAKRYYEPMIAEVQRNYAKIKIDNEKLKEELREKSERLAMVDYDELSEIDKEVRDNLLKGEFKKADSLILSKGSIEERMNYGKNTISSIINDFKILSDNALIELNFDKSIEYLENIISIDPDNIPVLLELGNIYCMYKSDVNSGQVYINQAIFFAKKSRQESPTELAECYSYKAYSYFFCRNFKESINALRTCLSFYDVPNIPEIGKLSNMEIDSVNTGEYPVTTRKDSSIVSNAYLTSATIFSTQGKHKLALKIRKISESLINYSSDDDSVFNLIISEIVQKFQIGLHDSVIQDITEALNAIKDNEFSDIHVLLNYLLAASYSEIGKLDSTYYHTDKIIQHYREKKRNYYDQYYIGAWSIKTKTLALERKFNEVLYYTNIIENEVDFRNAPYQDIIASIYNNKGLAHLERKEYDKAIVELLKSSSILTEMNKSGTPKTSLNMIVNANLAMAYENITEFEKARIYIYKAFSEGKTLYKEIGYEHYLFYMIVDYMYQLEIKSNLFKEAMDTAILCHNVLDREKETYRNRIEECYKLAKSSKQYKKSKEYKELVKKYNEFTKNNPINR